MELDLTVTGLHKSAAFYLPNHLLLKRDVCIFHFLMIYDYECSLVEKSESERKSCLIDLFCCLQNMPYGYVRYQKRSGFRKKGDEQFSTSYFSFVSSWLNNRWRMHLTLFSCKWWLIFRYLHAAWLGRKHLLVIGNWNGSSQPSLKLRVGHLKMKDYELSPSCNPITLEQRLCSPCCPWLGICNFLAECPDSKPAF